MTSLRKIATAQKVAESGGKVAVSKAMLESGYSIEYAANPQKLTRQKDWPTLLEKFLPDKLLASKHKELLTVPRKVRTYQKGQLMTEVEETDTFAVGKGLELAYKLKSKYPVNDDASRAPIAVINVVNFGENPKPDVIEAENT